DRQDRTRRRRPPRRRRRTHNSNRPHRLPPLLNRRSRGRADDSMVACWLPLWHVRAAWPASHALSSAETGFFLLGTLEMSSAYLLVIACGVLALAYGWFTSRQVLTANAGTARMQEISGAVQIGARAYLNRQYRTIAIVGIVVLIVLGITLGPRVAIGYLIGAVLSASAGYIG